MLISKIDNTNFTSRNATICFADRMAREVNVKFPSLSLSMTNRYNNRYKVQKFHQGESKVCNRVCKAHKNLAKIVPSKKKNYTKLNEFLKIIEKYKMADCFERSIIALMMAKCSGIKNCSIKGLYSKEDGWLDHAVVYVADKKNPYVIDPWLGFADYVPKTFEKYNGEYRNYFRRILFGGRNGDFYFEKDSRKHFPFQSLITDRILTPNAINKFAKIRPELFLK